MAPVPNTLNPLELIARRWQPSAAFVRRAALATVIMAVIIVVTGGAVRLSQSGLGCSTWPKCTPDSLTPTAAMGINGLIEFGNRLLTYVLCAVVGLFIIAARARHPRRRSLTRLGWAQFWLVMSNAVIGGVTVLTGLNPYIVSSHFLAATALLTVAVLSWKRASEGDEEPRDLVARPARQLAWLLVAATGALTVIGTVVTGTGPHAGDAKKVHRIPLDWQEITQLHVDFVYIVVGLSVALWFTLRAVKAAGRPAPDAPGAVRLHRGAGRHRLRPVLHGPARDRHRAPHAGVVPGVDLCAAGQLVAARPRSAPGGGPQRVRPLGRAGSPEPQLASALSR